MNKERIDDLVDIIGNRYAELENSFVIRNNMQLAQYIDNPERWKLMQLASRARYKRELIGVARAKLAELNALSERVYLLGYREVAPGSVEITRTEIVAKDIPQTVRDEINRQKALNIKEVTSLANLGFKSYEQSVRVVSALAKPDTLYETIKTQMTRGIDKGLMVTYKNKRNYTWKAYMEMNTRTTVHQELGKEQVRAGAAAGVVFYMCDSFADSAKDHASYQGKLYYNADTTITKEISEWISAHKIPSMQEVRDSAPWLTTRPNCRHNFHAIPNDEAMGKSEAEVLKAEGLEKGQYKDSNYAKVQQQRLNERTIRKYKMRLENGDALYAATGDTRWKPTGDEKQMIKKWQGINRELISKNPELLKRDYDRENIKVVVQDLGVRYDQRRG